MITVSIVSHGHGRMVLALLDDLRLCPEVSRILITRNIPEVAIPYTDERVRVIDNPHPKGFGANHNAAFQYCETDYFCVLNPDIRIPKNPFLALLQILQQQQVGLVAPKIIAPNGRVEDSIRRFPTLIGLVAKALRLSDGRYLLPADRDCIHPEWVAGMFMLFRQQAFAALKGFDETYFLYYEDVDICVRLWRSQCTIVACLSVFAVHEAQRASHRNWRHMRWHLGSMTRYFMKHLGRLPTVKTA